MPPFVQNFFQSLGQILNFTLFKLGQTEITPATLLTFLILCAGIVGLERVVRKHLMRRVLSRTGLDASLQYSVSRVIGYLILILGFYIALLVVGVDLGSLAVVAGAFGVGLGFGLQNVISNFVSGIIILFERSLKVGDFVELESGVAGEVQEINMRSTWIVTNDNIDILVPNSEFVNGRVINWTLKEACRRVRVPFGVAYGADKELVRQAGLEAADRVPHTVKDDPKRRPQVWFVRFGNSSLDFELVVWIGPDAVKRPASVQAAYLWEIHTSLYAHQIEIPFPQNDLHLRSFFGLKDQEAKRWFEQRFGGDGSAAPGAPGDRRTHAPEEPRPPERRNDPSER